MWQITIFIEGLSVPATFEKQDYAIALPEDSPLREPLNRTLLEALTDPEWQNTVQRYLGRLGA
jgi:polar amino acid transport system substrate-binding protein